MESSIALFTVAMIIIIVAIFFMISNHTDRENSFKSAISKIPGFNVGAHFVSHSGDCNIATNSDFSKIYLSKTIQGIPYNKVFPSYNLLSSEIIEDGQSIIKTVRSSQIGGAIVGGLMLGGVGAVIGGLSGRKTNTEMVNRITLRIIVNDPGNPIYDVCFLSRETNKNSIAYKSAIQTAQEWQARLEVMIKRADKINEAQPIAETIQKVKKSKKVKKEKNSVRVSDELLKLTDLRDGGLLTDDEFEDRISKLNS